MCAATLFMTIPSGSPNIVSLRKEIAVSMFGSGWKTNAPMNAPTLVHRLSVELPLPIGHVYVGKRFRDNLLPSAGGFVHELFSAP